MIPLRDAVRRYSIPLELRLHLHPWDVGRLTYQQFLDRVDWLDRTNQ